MKLFQTGKRVLLFVLVNVLVLLTISLVLQLLGVNRSLGGGGTRGLLIFCAVWGMGGALISLALSRFMAKMFMGVKVVDPGTGDPVLRELVESVHGFARRAGLPKMPEVGVYESPDVNAFATGPTKSRSLVAVSTGLLQRMNRRETDGVLAHEVAHIANGDMVTMTLIQGVINAFVMFLARILAFAASLALSRGGEDEDAGPSFWLQYLFVFVFEIVLSLLGALVVCWFSRQREFRADAGGMLLAGKEQMIGALQALQRLHGVSPARDEHLSFQSLKISGQASGLMALFSTHPPLERRIAYLQGLQR